MTAKPTTLDGYSSDQLDIVTRTCLYVFTKLGDLCNEVVVVGGLVPYLLVDQDDPPTLLGTHSGTMDLDLGLALAILDEQRRQRDPPTLGHQLGTTRNHRLPDSSAGWERPARQNVPR